MTSARMNEASDIYKCLRKHTPAHHWSNLTRSIEGGGLHWDAKRQIKGYTKL